MTAPDMQIIQITDARMMKRFHRFAWEVYRANPHWVPPLLSEMNFVLSARNPFFRHAEAVYFLAHQNGRLIGRIAAIIDRNHIEIHQEQAGFFGYFECLPDPAAAEGLLNAAAAWLKQRGMAIMRGPMNPSTNDECGFLLEGFDSPPMIMMPYGPPYYHEFMDRCGLVKAKDLYAYIIIVDDVQVVQRLESLSRDVYKRVPGLRVRPVDVKRLDRELTVVKDIYNSAWSKNWGFVPMTDEEIDAMAKRLKSLIVPELLIIAEVDDDPAAFFMVVPDYNQVLHKLNGRLLPLGIFKFLWYARRITDVRGITLGVKAQYRKKGIEGLLYLESFRAAKLRGYKRAEMSWILEDNTLAQKGCEFMGGERYKTYRIYEKKL